MLYEDMIPNQQSPDNHNYLNPYKHEAHFAPHLAVATIPPEEVGLYYMSEHHSGT